MTPITRWARIPTAPRAVTAAPIGPVTRLGLIGAISTAITTRLRTSEITVYRMSGTAPASVMALLNLEALLLAGTAALAATAAALTLTPIGPTEAGGFGYFLDPTVLVLWGLTLAGTWATASLLTTTDFTLRRPDDLAKDRRSARHTRRRHRRRLAVTCPAPRKWDAPSPQRPSRARHAQVSTAVP